MHHSLIQSFGPIRDPHQRSDVANQPVAAPHNIAESRGARKRTALGLAAFTKHIGRFLLSAHHSPQLLHNEGQSSDALSIFIMYYS